jgi:hypothetical protein
MTIHQALALVRDKYLDEGRGVTSGLTADRYRRACQDYPAMMISAHYHWASEVSRTAELEVAATAARAS